MKRKFNLTDPDYRYLFENAPDAIWLHDLDGNITAVNRVAEELTGYRREELLTMNVRSFLTEGSLNLARKIKHKLFSGEMIEQQYEQKLTKKDGTEVILRLTTSLIKQDDNLIALQHIARDVTEEKRFEEIVSKITNGSPIPLFVIDKQHKVTNWNIAIEVLSGINKKEIVGTDRQWQAFYNEKRPTMADLIVDGASADEIEVYYPGRCKVSRLIDGAYEAEDFFADLGESGKWLHFTASPIKNEAGQKIGAIETLQDISEEKKLQENMGYYVQLITKAQEEERKRVARDLHDNVSSFLLLLTQGLDATITSDRPRYPQALKRKLEILRGQAVKALEELQRCAQNLRPRILDDLGLVGALEWMTEDLEKNYGIMAHVEVMGTEPGLPIEVQLLLFRIAQEALGNIRRHAKASTATIKLGFEDNSIRMTVSDNGKGFEVSQKTGDLASIGKLGILGMYERARLLDGTLEIKSELGKGTTIVMEAPV
ncbi:PAS domain S-box protein [Chloroflexota bacterium]